MPSLARITIYPIKSLDGLSVAAAEFVGAGGLRNDRRFALRGPGGEFVNGKRFAAVHSVRACFDDAVTQVTLSAPARSPETFRLAAGDVALERWFGDYFGFHVTLEENTETGFPDDLDSPGPTLIGGPTLRTVCGWFPELRLDEARRRFRANLEIDVTGDSDDCPAFWEDRLFGEHAAPDVRAIVPFRIGAARLEGTNPCARCVVPTRDSHGGEPTAKFAATLAARRRDSLPAWAATSAFDHYYRLAVNTRAGAAVGRVIRVGDEVELLA